MSDDAPTLESLLEHTRERLLQWMQREARGLLRFETDEDLVQGVHSRAVGEAGAFDFRGDGAFWSWLVTLARRHVADRHDYWSALKRGSGQVLRLTFSGSRSGDPDAAAVPAGIATGPGTFASRREMLVLATRALDLLPERDRQFVRWNSQGVELETQAEELGLSYAAAQRAGLRALERFRKTYKLLAQRR